MSIWTDFRDAYEFVESGFQYNPWQSRENDRLVNEQIKQYQDQTALAKQQLDEARASTEANKRRVEEKQIRALRRNYRAGSAGLLGVGSPGSQDMDQKLGG